MNVELEILQFPWNIYRMNNTLKKKLKFGKRFPKIFGICGNRKENTDEK